MRALSLQEIDNLVLSLRTFVGARLQEAVVGKSGCGLGLFAAGEIVWLWFDAHTWSPMLLPMTEVPEGNLKPHKPLLLFLRAHFIGQRLVEVHRREDLGRGVELQFGDEEEPRAVEIRLWPHGGNLLALAESKRVAWQKPDQPLVTTNTIIGGEPQVRGLETLLEEWIQLRFARRDVGAKDSKKPKDSPERQREIQIARLEKAIGKVREEIKTKSGSPWRESGDWLVKNQSLAAPDGLRPFLDTRRSLAWNIENSFSRAKENEKKLISTRERLKKLEDDLAKVRAAPLSETPVEKAQNKKKSKAAKATARFRTVQLSGGLVAKVGRSAADNLQLLRGAKPWDFWMHLRDYPGSHAIVSREKNKLVSDEVLRIVGQALVEQTFGAKSKQHIGERFEMIVAECRFVRPIRGDRHGLVNYSHDRTVGFRHT